MDGHALSRSRVPDAAVAGQSNARQMQRDEVRNAADPASPITRAMSISLGASATIRRADRRGAHVPLRDARPRALLTKYRITRRR